MKLKDKIHHLENYLNKVEQNYADSFKQDILIYFNEDFSEENQQLIFLNNLNTTEEIEALIDNLTSQFVLKFDENQESENDFIHDYLSFILSSTNQ
ncbi:hypothetical protein [Flavobacterium aquatile]|uniref:Uncharacterized protein n=1 Tax=Flavobacterium aquatile LMG 4008 = ATCC 11947 TaxID=1453498 RepID=A0A095SWD5_9FLAO|nr:hypothetical protein [Flavobacterium aquatile]KGD68902.1 hypothetical protein LG45_04455 [Flavobacterium aquatile LMG 4008 = ATCC 11947]OXA69420.1 hypothetical protein B0A61_01025 [Flavobacterium aquatile LMG 4008 = ATCC 11947]GEC79393.1 hypothetical protein FAQ01_22630 [Flavobacterium aquatile]